MSAKVLEDLTSEDLAVRLAFLSTPSALRACLQKTAEVAELTRELRLGAITEDGIKSFMSGLLEDLRIGERFQQEMAVAALAVALETRPTDFAEQFLRNLSGLRLAEMGAAARVARECLKRRVTLADSKARLFNATHPDVEPPSCGSPFPRPVSGIANTTASYTCEVA